MYKSSRNVLDFLDIMLIHLQIAGWLASVGLVALDAVDDLITVGERITEFGGDISKFFLDLGHGEINSY